MNADGLPSSCNLRTVKMTPDQLKKRTKDFGIRIVKLVEKLPAKRSSQRLGDQLLVVEPPLARITGLPAAPVVMQSFDLNWESAKKKLTNRFTGLK